MNLESDSHKPCDDRRLLDVVRGDHKLAGNHLGMSLLSAEKLLVIVLPKSWTLLLLAVVKLMSVTLITS